MADIRRVLIDRIDDDEVSLFDLLAAKGTTRALIQAGLGPLLTQSAIQLRTKLRLLKSDADGIVALARLARQRLRDDERQPLAEADVREDLELRLRAVLPLQGFPAVPRDRFGLDLQRRERLIQQAFAERRGFLLLQPLQVMADPRARFAGGDERQP